MEFACSFKKLIIDKGTSLSRYCDDWRKLVPLRRILEGIISLKEQAYSTNEDISTACSLKRISKYKQILKGRRQ